MKSINNITKITFLNLFLILIILLFSCKKDKEDLVPYVYVDFNIYLTNPNFVNLNSIGNSVYVTGGVEGIVIYRKSQDEFIAIERCCSYIPADRRIVEKDSTGQALICPYCNSRFSIFDGSVIKTPAKRPLTLYHTAFDPGNLSVHVSN